MDDSYVKAWGVGMFMGIMLCGVLLLAIPKAFIPGTGWKCTLWVNTRIDPIEQACNQWSKE